MIFHHRRLVMLCVLAVLVAGTAIGSRRFGPSLAAEASVDRLLGEAQRAERLRLSTFHAPAAQTINPPTQTPDAPKSARRQFTVYRDESGQVVCREATADEIKQREGADLSKLGLRQINHPELDKSSGVQVSEATGLVIILRATTQLQANAAATAAFNRAAQNWENVIMSPITIYIDVDFGSTNFGQPWGANVLGATHSPSSGYPYQSVRANLNAEATGEGNATKQAIFGALPTTAVPTDLGNASAVDVSDSTARAIGLLPATAQSTDDAARIAFNSNNAFDFDPSDGITAGAIDFDAVATHEIGHALGFDSDAGENLPKPSVWDLYRFRSGTTSATFPNAQRLLTIGGSPDPFQYDFIPGNVEIGLSTGGPTGSSANGADGWQSSHWKHVSTCDGYIGIMDPAIPNGCRRTITNTDTLALTSFGYNLTNNNAPPPPPPSPTPPANDNFANAQIVPGCSGSVTGSTFGATKETGEPSHDPSDATSLSPSHSIWYEWQAPSSGTATITTQGSDFDTILAVYTGTTLSTLTQLASNDDVQNGIIRTSSVTFTATSGTVYWIAVDGWGGDMGTVKLNWNACGGTPTPTPTPTASPTPTPTPSPGSCPTVLTVNDLGDTTDASPGDGICATAAGVCTLRAAIQEANARASCGTIDIDFSGVNGSITLSTALPDINHNLNINGPGANQLTVQRNGSAAQFRIFQVQTGAANISATISGLTASGGMFSNGNGNLAGGIYNAGSLVLTDVTVSGNSSGGIWNNRGTLTLINSSVLNNSNFGINTIGTLTLTNSTVSGNTGSGISNNGAVIVTNSTISGNTTTAQGGGIWSDSLESTGTVTNSTISGNNSHSFGGGIYHMRGTLTLTNVTITNNRADADNVGTGTGGGIFQLSSIVSTDRINLKNTIVAGNSRGNGSTSDDINGSVMSTSSFSLIGDGTGATGISNGAAGNQVGTGTAPIKGLLGPLANNGGPTMTHALVAGSPAINAGSNALAVDQNGVALTTDQRGTNFTRVVNGTVDIGAFELQASNPIDDPTFFVKQQYLDFLNRQPDQSGWDFWTNQITSCGSDAQCVQVKRVNTSGAFFLSIEFQQTGNLVYKMYKAAFGNLPGKPVAVDRASFIADTRQIQSTPAQVIVGQGDWQTQLETNKQAFALAFVQRANFQTQHAGQAADTYVNSLFTNTGVAPTPAEVAAAVNAFNNAGGGDTGRAAALRSVAESNSVAVGLNNEAFVLMQYFGYLQRNPNDLPDSDYSGFNFWLGKLNQFNGDFIAAEMVKAFISSSEYRQRFGP
jgi:CSLREA domain-containing protein